MSDKAFLVRKGLAVNIASPLTTFHVASNDAVVVPIGTTAQRPTPSNGMFRYNSQTSKLEGVVGGSWVNVATGTSLSIGGSNTYIQFNDSDVLGGDANLVFDKTAAKITLGNSSVNTAINTSTIVTGTVTVGSTVLNANVVKRDTTANLQVGYTTSSVNNGVKSTGTFTPNAQLGQVQVYYNNGAHTLAPISDYGSIMLDLVNQASAGAVTTSGFTKVSGDTITTTNTQKFRLFISKGDAGTHLHVQALQ